MARYEPVLEMTRGAVPKLFMAARTGGEPALWSPSWKWALATGAFVFVAIASLTRNSEFLYWQF